jgi:Leucine-rich repeat (LRR) protein
MTASNNLNGAIPKEIGMLKDLQYLLVAYNRLVSTLPESLFELSALKGVDFNGNSISGTLPSTFVKATGLEVLHLGSNALRGPISLDHIVDNVFCPLTLVVLTGNTFSGTFPLERIAANCTDMTAININDAGLTVDGSIPPQGLEQLTLLDLTKSELAGSLPNEISRLWRLQEFKADFNTLTGTLPTTLGKLIALTDLSLSINNLEGTIPSELGQLQQLTSLVLSSNILSGTVPSELASCTKLVEVKLEMNTLSGDMDMLCSLSLERLTSDCDTRDIVCSCCSECY